MLASLRVAALLKVNLGVFLALCCQRGLYARRSLRDVLSCSVGLPKLSLGSLLRFRNAFSFENLGKRVVILLECYSPSLKRNLLIQDAD